MTLYHKRKMTDLEIWDLETMQDEAIREMLSCKTKIGLTKIMKTWFIHNENSRNEQRDSYMSTEFRCSPKMLESIKSEKPTDVGFEVRYSDYFLVMTIEEAKAIKLDVENAYLTFGAAGEEWVHCSRDGYSDELTAKRSMKQ